MDRWMGGQMKELMVECMHRLIDGWMDSMDGSMHG